MMLRAPQAELFVRLPMPQDRRHGFCATAACTSIVALAQRCSSAIKT